MKIQQMLVKLCKQVQVVNEAVHSADCNFHCVVVMVMASWKWCHVSIYIYIYNSVRLFVCLFVCSFAIRAKTTAQNATKLSGIIKWGSVSVLHGLKPPALQFLKRYPSISGFSFAADGHFINYRSPDFR